MRRAYIASILAGYLEGDRESPLLREDPELRDLVGLARGLEGAGRLEVRPDPGRQNDIKLRLLQKREELARERGGRRGTDVERLLRPVLPEPRRYLYAGVVAFILLAVVAASAFWYVYRPSREKAAPPEVPPLALLLDTTGPVEVRIAGGEWETRTGRVELPEGSSLRTLRDPAEVRAGDSALFRLDAGSEVEVALLEEASLGLRLAWGQAYHRVLRPYEYGVRIGEVSCSARGTAFNTERRGGSGLLVLALHDETGISHGRDRHTLQPGSRYLVEDVNDPEGTGSAGPVAPEDLDKEWLRYNLEEDLRRGWDPGVLPELLAEPSPQEPPAVDMTAQETEGGILLRWQVSGADPASFEILRSTRAKLPVWPDHLYKELKDPAARQFLDAAVKHGTTYYYRLSMLVNGERIYSEAVSVTTQPEPQPEPPPEPQPEPPPEPRIFLSGRQVQGSSSYLAVQLDWRLEGDLQVDTWMVCRSISVSSPTYPPVGYDSLAFAWPYRGKADSYLDEENLYTGYVYHYRVAALYQNRVALYSNPISVEVMTIIP